MAAIEEVNDQAQNQPRKEREPGQHFESHHQHNAEDNAQNGEDRAERSLEAAFPLRLPIAQNDDRDGDQHKGKQCADIRQV